MKLIKNRPDIYSIMLRQAENLLGFAIEITWRDEFLVWKNLPQSDGSEKYLTSCLCRHVATPTPSPSNEIRKYPTRSSRSFEPGPRCTKAQDPGTSDKHAWLHGLRWVKCGVEEVKSGVNVFKQIWLVYARQSWSEMVWKNIMEWNVSDGAWMNTKERGMEWISWCRMSGMKGHKVVGERCWYVEFKFEKI